MRGVATFQDKCIDGHLLVASLLGLFKQRGLDCDKVLRGTGIFVSDMTKTEHFVSAKQLLRLIDNALAMWPSGDLSFLLGQLWLPSQSGPLTAGMFCAKDVNELGRFWHQYHWLTHPWLQCWRWQGESEWHFLLSLDLGTQKHQQFFIELSLSSLVSTCKQLMGEGWQGSICFPYRTPSHLAQYYKYFGSDIRFEAPFCRVSMSYTFMMQPLLFYRRTASGELAPTNSSVELHLSHKIAPGERLTFTPNAAATEFALHAISKPVRRQWRQAPFRLGFAASIRLTLMRETMTLPQLAQHMGLSPATVKRRLAEMDLTFGQLVDETRLLKALYRLSSGDIPAETIADSLDFSDASNFRRSFKRWTGQLPRHFRCWLA